MSEYELLTAEDRLGIVSTAMRELEGAHYALTLRAREVDGAEAAPVQAELQTTWERITMLRDERSALIEEVNGGIPSAE